MIGIRKKGLERRTIDAVWVNGTRLDRAESRAESLCPETVPVRAYLEAQVHKS